MNHLVTMLPDNSRVLTFRDEYPSNIIPFIENNFDTSFIESDSRGDIKIEDVESAIKTADVLIASHVEYRTGYKHDLNALGQLCKESGTTFVVDATQSAGIYDIHFQSIGADALVFSTHKWLNAGYSMACMIVSSDLIAKHPPKIVGWKSASLDNDSNLGSYSIKKNAEVFELGHPDFISIYALMAQLNFISSIGIENIESRITELRAYFEHQCEVKGIKILNSFNENNKSSMMIVGLGKSKVNRLRENDIDFTHRENKVMIALSYYNNSEDIDKFVSLAA